jgi:ribokinase
MNPIVQNLIDGLNDLSPPKSKVVVMPHFCIDNLILYDKDFDSFSKSLEDIASRGGGNMALSQHIQVGGKAANCAKALASLGVSPYLIARTNEIGYILLEHFFRDYDVDLSHVKKDGELAFTSSFELQGANIMISDPGSLSNFGPEVLSESDRNLIHNADYVIISDWGLNNKGTELAKEVFKWTRKGRGRTFFDPGDPSPKGENLNSEILKLITELIQRGLVDVLSLNLEEAEKFMGIDYLRTMTRVDIHSNDYARCFFGFKDTEEIPTLDVQPKSLTGAGDAWNAGDMFGEIIGLSDELRLLCANSVAAFYISDPQGKHPTVQELIEFLKDQGN